MPDPVCGMQVDPTKAAGTSQYQGQMVLLLLEGLQDEVRREPRGLSAVVHQRTRGIRSGRPGLRHEHSSVRRRRARHPPRADVPLLQPGVPRQVPGVARHLPGAACGSTVSVGPARRQPGVHVSDGPGGPSIGPGACPKCGMALEPVSAAPLTRTEWTCPMHPEIVRDEPGSCPICGMALEPRTVTLEEQNPELDDMTRRFRWSSLMTVPILAFMISEFLPGQPLQHALAPAWMTWTQFLLATPVVLWGGWPFFVRGWASLVNRHLNMFTLIALGVGAAYGFSVVATLAPGLFPGIVPHARRSDWRLLRAGGGNRCARAPRPGAGASRAQPHEFRDQEAAGPDANDGAAHRRGRRGEGRPARARPRRRSSARAARRTRAG